jgi:hypothetical protein
MSTMARVEITVRETSPKHRAGFFHADIKFRRTFGRVDLVLMESPYSLNCGMSIPI